MALSFTNQLKAVLTPHTSSGTELCEVIEQWFVDHPQDQDEAYQILKSFLIDMRTANASDLDMGAPGCGGNIWFRIYQTKNPCLTMESMITLKLPLSSCPG